MQSRVGSVVDTVTIEQGFLLTVILHRRVIFTHAQRIWAMGWLEDAFPLTQSYTIVMTEQGPTEM